jgi:hypothetical protein
MKRKIKVVVIGHRAGSKRQRAHALIQKMGGMRADPSKAKEAIRKTLRVKPATATSWFYDMRRAKSRVHEPRAAR